MVAGLLTVQMLLFGALIHFFPFGIHRDLTEWVRVLCLQKSCDFKTLYLSRYLEKSCLVKPDVYVISLAALLLG